MKTDEQSKGDFNYDQTQQGDGSTVIDSGTVPLSPFVSCLDYSSGGVVSEAGRGRWSLKGSESI